MINIQSIQVSNRGAELTSLIANDREYLWQGDPNYWGRRAPILFPVVGRLADDKLRINGEEYHMSQHGFARDTDFVECDENHYRIVESNHPNYPYNYDLSVKYKIEGNTVSCLWLVHNKGTDYMHFQIGAHPAFNLPDYNIEDVIHGYLQCFDSNGRIVTPAVNSFLKDGLRHQYVERKTLFNENALIAITNDTFNDDAIIFEKGQVASIALLDKTGCKVLSVVCSQADVFGLWSPNKLGCPFVCIEPWCGIADRCDFNGEISEREFNHSLAPGNTCLFNYSIKVF